jgi:hypothetical protein
MKLTNKQSPPSASCSKYSAQHPVLAEANGFNFPLDLKDQLSYTNKIGGKSVVLCFYLPTFLIAEEKTEDPEPNNIYRI